ncbi:MAG: hypothetical protein ABW034_02125 [Steroidobacteraceae bacterium]
MIPSYALSQAEENPVATLPDVASWSENYAFYGYDYSSQIGFTAFVGRWIKNPALWREQLFIYLPDGTLLSHKAIGPAANASEASGGALRASCDAPGKRWQLRFEGAMRHDSFDSFRREPILEGRPYPVRFETVLACDTPVWMMSTQDNSSYGKFHYEQGHTSRGSVDFNGKQYAFNGPGFRDHSRGPRHLGGFDGHTWIQLFFPDGKLFATYQAWAKQGTDSQRILDQSIVMTGQEIHQAKLIQAPRLTALEQLRDPVELRVSIDDREHTLRGKPFNQMLNSFTEDFDFYYGVAPQLAEFMSMDQPMLFDTDVGVVRGCVQRSMRISPTKRVYP